MAKIGSLRKGNRTYQLNAQYISTSFIKGLPSIVPLPSIILPLRVTPAERIEASSISSIAWRRSWRRLSTIIHLGIPFIILDIYSYQKEVRIERIHSLFGSCITWIFSRDDSLRNKNSSTTGNTKIRRYLQNTLQRILKTQFPVL